MLTGFSLADLARSQSRQAESVDGSSRDNAGWRP